MTADLELVRTLVVCLVMAVLAALLLLRAGVGLRWEPIIGIARAAAQLLVLALVLAFMITSVGWVLLWLGVMATVAVLTATRRIGASRETLLAVAGGVLLGGGATLAIAFASGTVALGPQYLLALGGITIGNAMSVATVTAKRLRESLAEHRHEVEGWLALGATPRQSAARFRAAASRLALIPHLDQVKTTGLVTLPGAFTGAVFAGASPLQAGLFQLVVLAGILLTGAICTVVVTGVLGAPTTLPAEPRD